MQAEHEDVEHRVPRANGLVMLRVVGDDHHVGRAAAGTVIGCDGHTCQEAYSIGVIQVGAA